MKQKNPIFLEYLWLLIATASLVFAIIEWNKNGIKEAASFFVIVLISLFMYAYRKNFRKKQNVKNE